MLTSLIVFGLAVLTVIMILAFLASRYKRVENTGQALVITRTGGKRDATFTGALVWPVINQFERMDVTKKRITIKRQGRKGGSGEEYEGLPCKDNIRADLKVDFYIGVNNTPEAVIRVAEHFTCQGVSSAEKLQDYFGPKFSEALKTVIKRFDFNELYDNREGFRKAIKEHLEKDLDGFVLHDVSIDKIDMTPLDAHDSNNVLDAVGIRKIIEVTSIQNIASAELKENAETQTKQKHVTGENARLQLSKLLETETAKTNREIETIQITERNSIEIRKQESRLELEAARLKTDQEISITEENVNREVEVTRINNEKVVGIQREQVNRAKEVEKVATTRQVSEKELDTEKFVEGQKAEIAVIVAERTNTERGIALAEEETSNLKVKHQTDRQKLVATTDATAKAQSDAIIKTTASEASLTVVKNEAAQDVVKADTKFQTAEKEASAIERIADATRKEKASVGLAEADVRERIAEVADKEVIVEANRVREVGNAQADVRLKQAEATEKEGFADAVRVREAGLAEAEGDKARYEAMGSIHADVREHEIKKLNIDKQKAVELAAIESNATVAIKGSEVMSAAMASANIQVLGGAEIFDQVRNAIVTSKAQDARIDNNTVLSAVFDKYRNGERDLAKDIKEVLEKSETSTGDVGNLLISSGLAGMIKNGTLQQLLNSFANGK